MEQLQIYGEGRNRIYEKELIRLKECKTSNKNKELITQFHNYMFSTGTKELRVAKLSSHLRRIVIILNNDLDKATVNEIQTVVAYYNRQKEMAEATKADYRRSIKQFYKWYQDEDLRLDSTKREIRKTGEKFYKYIGSITICYKRKQIDPNTIITDEQINLIVSNGCKTFKEKAFVKLLHETGARAGEFLNIRIRDIVIENNHATVSLDGKTGKRRVPITTSVGYLTAWLEIHPFKDNVNYFLWSGECPRIMHKPIHHRGAQKLIDRCFEKSGFLKKEYAEVKLANGKISKKLISKEVLLRKNLHWFRHSRATLLAPHLTEALLCKYMGWKLGSRQVQTYIHLCNDQLEDAYLKFSGLKKEEKETTNQPKECHCGAVNDSICRYCFQCGNPLSVEVAVQDQEMKKTETDKSIKLLMEITQNPELMQMFQKFKEQIKR